MTIFLSVVAIYMVISFVVGLNFEGFVSGLFWPLYLVLWIIHLAGFRIR